MNKKFKILSFIFAVVLLVTLGCVALFAENTPKDVAQVGDTKYPSLAGALGAVEDGDTITLLEDITLNEWTAVSMTKGFTFEGNGKTITGLSQPLFQQVGNQDCTIKNLTIKNPAIVGPTTFTGNSAAGALIGWANESISITIDNCHVIGGSITETRDSYAGGLIGYTAGGTTAEIVNSSVEDVTIHAVSSMGGFIGHTNGGTTIINSVVGGNTLIAGDNVQKLGAVIGTVNSGDAYIDVIEGDATIGYTDATKAETTPVTTVGRIYTGTTTITYAGSYHSAPNAYNRIPDGNAGVDDTKTVYGGELVQENGRYNIYKAAIDDQKFFSVQAAVDAVAGEGTIELLGNCYEALTIDKKLTINLNGNQLINELVVTAADLYGAYNGDAYEVKQITNWIQGADTSWYDASKAEFTLSTAKQLAGLAKLVNEGTTFVEKTVYLGNDVDLSAATWPGIGARTKNDDTYTFRGTFDGKENAIIGMTFSVANFNNYCGFFNRIVDATVKNLKVTSDGFGDATFSESDEFGGAIIVGSAKNSTIYNCVANGSILGNHNVAGIVVRVTDSQITKCVNNAAITGTYTKMAGIAAFIEGDTKGNASAIDQCVNNGDITVAVEPKNPSADKIPGADGAGGIVGWYRYSNDAYGSITNNTNNGKITVLGDNTTATIGQIAAESWDRHYIFKGNQGRIDQVATGHAAQPGLNFAITESGKAVYADIRTNSNGEHTDILVAGNTYLVTANGAAPSITLAPSESITFDQSIAKLGAETGIRGKWVKTTDGDKVTYTGALVEMNGVSYATFNEAWLVAVKNGGAQTITLLGDSTFVGTGYGTDMNPLDLTIDLNGRNLILKAGLPVAGSMYGGNALTITDKSTAADGKMFFDGDSYIGFINDYADALIIEGGSFVKNEGTKAIIQDNAWGVVNRTITLNGGDFTGVQTAILDVDKGDNVTKSADVEVKAPEGYFWNNDTDLTVAVATLDGKAYASFADAIAAATDGDTVKLLANTSFDTETWLKNFNLDLNGKELTYTGPSYGIVTSGKSVTISNGRIIAAGSANAGVNVAGQSLVLDNVIIDNTSVAGQMSFCLIAHSGTTQLKNGSRLLVATNLTAPVLYNCAIRLYGNVGDGAIVIDVDDAVVGGDIVVNGQSDLVDQKIDLSADAVVDGKFTYKDSAGKEYSADKITVNAATNDQLASIGCVASIGNKGYTSFASALTAANNGDIVTMLASTTLTEKTVINGNITIAVNGYTVTGLENIVAEASAGIKGGYFFGSFVDAIAAAADGATVTLLADVELTTQVNITKTLTLSLGNYKLFNLQPFWNKEEKLWSLISVQGGNLTIVDGNMVALDGDVYALDVRNGGTLTIEDGYFVGNISAVYVFDGSLIINGGTFEIQQLSSNADPYAYTINAYDQNYATGEITINGGNFRNWNPANNVAEGAGTVFTPEGYASVFKDGYYIPQDAVKSGLGAVYDGVLYATLADAYAAAVNAGDKDISIKLVKNRAGAGIVVESGVKLTVDFNGCYYSINSPVGSKNTETNGFQLKEGATVVLTSTATYEDGEIALGLLYSEPNSGVKLLIQNYADLTVSNMLLMGYYLDEPKNGSANYTLSINSGNVTVTNSTIAADIDGDNFAFDIYGWYSAYDAPVVTVTDSVIYGDIEISSDGSNEELAKTLGFAAFENNEHDGRIVNQLDGTNEFIDASGATLVIDDIGVELGATYNADTGIWEVTPDIDFVEGVSATMTFTLVNEYEDGTLFRVLHRHGSDLYIDHVAMKDGAITIENAVGFSTFEITVLDVNNSQIHLMPGESLSFYSALNEKNYTISTPTFAQGNRDDLCAQYYREYDRYAFGVITYKTLSAEKVYGTDQWYKLVAGVKDELLNETGSYETATFQKHYYVDENGNYPEYESGYVLVVAGDNSVKHFVVGAMTRDGCRFENVTNEGKHYLDFTLFHTGASSHYPIATEDNFIVDDSGAGDIVITPATITDNFLNDETKAQTMPYNGAAQTGEFPVNADFVLVNHPKNKDTMSVLFADKDGKYTLSAAPSVTDVKDGTLTVKYCVTAANHKPLEAEYTIQISKISLADAVFTLVNPDGFTYNSEPQTVKMNPIGDGTYFVTLTVGGKTFILIEGTDYTVSGNTATNAGKYTFTITGTDKGNYSGTASRDWSIAKRAVGIEIITPKLTYGNAWTQESFSIEAIGDDGVDYGAEIVGIYTTTGDILYNGAHYVHAGKQTVTFTLTDDEAINNENFKFADDAFTAEYEIAKKEIVAEIYYDGTVYYGTKYSELIGTNWKFRFPDADKKLMPFDDEGTEFYTALLATLATAPKASSPAVLETAPANTNVAMWICNGVQHTIFGNDYQMVADNPTAYYTKAVHISPRPITIKPLLKDGVDHAYGSSFENDDFTYEVLSSLGVVNNDILNIVYTVEDYEPGDDVKTYVISATESDNPNYAITIENGSVDITQRKLYLTPNYHTVIYGREYVQNPNPWEFGVLASDDDAWMEVVGKEIATLDSLFITTTDYVVGDDVGVKTISLAYIQGKGAGDHPNYDIDYSDTAMLFILPETTVNSFVAEFDKLFYQAEILQPTLLSLVINHAVLGEQPIDLSMVEVAEANEMYAGTYKIALEITGGNYEGAILTAEYTINRYVVDFVNWSDDLYEVDEDGHYILDNGERVISNKFDGTWKAPSATWQLNHDILTFSTTSEKYAGDHEFFVTGLLSIEGAEDQERALASYLFNYEMIDCGLYVIEEATPVKFYSANVVLGDEYAINFKIKQLALEQYGYTAADKDAILTLSYQGEAVKSEDFTLKLENGYYVVTFLRIAPQNMGKEVTASFNSKKFLNDPRDKSYSVAEYCYSRIDVYAEDAVIGDMNDENYVFVRTLLSMLRYGEAAEMMVHKTATLLTGTKYADMITDDPANKDSTTQYYFEKIVTDGYDPDSTKPVVLTGKYNFNLTVGLDPSSGNKLNLSYAIPEGLTLGVDDIRVQIYDMTDKVWLMTEAGDPGVKILTEDDLNASFIIPMNASGHEFRIVFSVNKEVVGDSFITLDMFVSSAESYIAAEALKQFGDCLNDWHKLVEMEALAA